ncbi:MAG: PEP-CTERM sorting domain-containing protein [Planctomycetota bacterium]
MKTSPMRSCFRFVVPAAVFGILIAAVPANAAIEFFGPVTPSGPGDGDIEDTLEIGEGTDPEDVFPIATVVVNGGDTLEFDDVYVGSDEGFFGRLILSGIEGSFLPTTVFRVESTSTNDLAALQVGRDGDGYLLVEAGAWLEMENDGGDVSIGDRLGGVGHMVVRDTNSLVTIGQNLIVGRLGHGKLDVTSGAIVWTEDNSSAGITIGDAAGSVGEVLVSGTGSQLRSADDLTVGNLGAGTLTIADGGVVDVDNSLAATTTVGPSGRVTLSSGTLRVQTLNVNGILEGSGLVRGTGTLTASTTARIEAGSGDLLRFETNVNSNAAVSIEGGEVEFGQGFTNLAGSGGSSPGRITLESGRASFSQGLSNAGVIAVSEGASDIHGDVTNEASGAITVSRDAVATFHDDFTDNGGTLTLLAGSNALFLSDLSFQAMSTLVLELDDDEISGPGPLLSVSGNADLAGEIQIGFPEDFAPVAGSTISLIEADSFTGSFVPPIFPTFEGGLTVDLVEENGVLALAVSEAGLEGDFNGDGVVNALDYTVWRDGLGIDFVPADGTTWANNYGATSSSTALAVPEPSTLMLVLIVSGFALRSRFTS